MGLSHKIGGTITALAGAAIGNSVPATFSKYYTAMGGKIDGYQEMFRMFAKDPDMLSKLHAKADPIINNYDALRNVDFSGNFWEKAVTGLNALGNIEYGTLGQQFVSYWNNPNISFSPEGIIAGGIGSLAALLAAGIPLKRRSNRRKKEKIREEVLAELIKQGRIIESGGNQ